MCKGVVNKQGQYWYVHCCRKDCQFTWYMVEWSNAISLANIHTFEHEMLVAADNFLETLDAE